MVVVVVTLVLALVVVVVVVVMTLIVMEFVADWLVTKKIEKKIIQLKTLANY